MRDSRPQLLDILFDDAFTTEKGPLHNIQQRATQSCRTRSAAPLVPCRQLQTGYFSAGNGQCQLDDALTL